MHADISTLVSVLVLAIVIYFRLLRPVRLRASRIWLGPAILIVLTLFAVWGSYEGHVAPMTIALAVLAGAILGVPFGLLRGRHTRVRTTEDPKVLVVEPSVIPLTIWAVAFLARFALRAFLPHAGPVALASSDGLLAFAVASVIGSRYVIAQKFAELHAE